MKIWTKMAAGALMIVTISACGGGGGGGTGGGGSSTSTTTGTGGATSTSTATSSTTGTTSSTGGTGGTTSTTTGPCVPKTCLTLAVEIAADAGVNDPQPDACGILSDTCGNFIDCGACDSPFQSCGGTAPKPNGSGPEPGQGGVASLCGGGCTALDDFAAGATDCIPGPVNQGGEVAVMCSAPTDAAGTTNKPPGWSSCHVDMSGKYTTYWCCKP